MRSGNRQRNELRPVKITRNYIKHAEGSVLIEMGDTKVVCTASVEERVPPFLRDSGSGWVTAEYGMLPRSAGTRIIRDAARGKINGRTHEIQRLIGRSMRSVVNLKALGERTVFLDCDVIQADGGTRTASITGAFVALYDALRYMAGKDMIQGIPVQNFVAAVSAGIVNKVVLLDLDYEEDSNAEVDVNIVMTDNKRFVEIQGTAERNPFTPDEYNELMKLAQSGIEQLILEQKNILGLL